MKYLVDISSTSTHAVCKQGDGFLQIGGKFRRLIQTPPSHRKECIVNIPIVTTQRTHRFRFIVITVVMFLIGVGVGLFMNPSFLDYLVIWPRSKALNKELQTIIVTDKDSPRARVAEVILTNHQEVRAYTEIWSVAYWGFSALAAILSALAGIILKLESWWEEKRKKDIAAVLSVAAALLVTISTSAGFQYKWQANRVAAAQLERLGYEFLKEEKEADLLPYLSRVNEALYKRHLAIIGSTDERAPTSPDKPASGN